jgi:hypothetical protein
MIKKIALVLSFLPWLYSCAIAQEPIQKKYADLLDIDHAKAHLSILASKEFEGRGTGQTGGQKAAQYIAKHFESLGLKAPNGSYFQPLKLYNSKFEVKQFNINGRKYTNGKHFYILGDNKETKVQSSEIVFVGYGIEDTKYNDFKDLDIKDKIVLYIADKEPIDKNGNSLLTGTSSKSEWSTSRNKRIQNLMAKKPKLILAATAATEQMLTRMSGRLTGGSYHLGDPKTNDAGVEKSAVAYITYTMADDILKQKALSIAQVESTLTSSATITKTSINALYGMTDTPLNDPNVLGLLEGSDLKDEILVISGHYDHDGIDANGTIFPGADDNGSGTTGVLELARAFAKAKADGHGPRRSILFLAFAAEEKGLLGSEYYSENPLYPLTNTVACLNMDMIGRIDDKHLSGNHNYIHVIGSDKLSSELHAINKKANDDYTQMELDYMYDDPKDPMRIYYRSDQYNFAKHKIPVIFYFSGLHPHYHTPEDTVDKIDFPMMVKREKLTFHTAWEIANRDKKLVVDSNKE